jgi:hypothetical protein
MKIGFVQTVVNDGWRARPRESPADPASMSLWKGQLAAGIDDLAQRRRLPVT